MDRSLSLFVCLSVCLSLSLSLSFSLSMYTHTQCGLFKRWRNFKKLDLTEETDGGFAYHHRAIPPIPGLNQNGAHGSGTMKEEESVGGASDKEREAEAEAAIELEIITRVCVCLNLLYVLLIMFHVFSSLSHSFISLLLLFLSFTLPPF